MKRTPKPLRRPGRLRGRSGRAKKVISLRVRRRKAERHSGATDSRGAHGSGTGLCGHQDGDSIVGGGAKALAAVGSALIVSLASLAVTAPPTPVQKLPQIALASETPGDITTIAGDGTYGYSGDGGPATSAELAYPDGVVTDAAGNVLLSDQDSFRVRIVAASTGTFYGQAMTADIYTIAGDGTQGSSGDGGPATSAELGQPEELAVDHHGNVLIADNANDAVVRVVAEETGTFYGQSMTAGDIYSLPIPYSYAGFPGTTGVAVDPAGNVLMAGSWGAASEQIYVLAESTGTYYGQSMTTGDFYLIAGSGAYSYFGSCSPSGSATGLGDAFQGNVTAIALDAAGNVLFVDGCGDVYVVASSCRIVLQANR